MDLGDVCRVSSATMKSALAEAIEIIYGRSRSVYRGIGYEYIDFRPYFIGDDVRHIDWRISARSMTNPYSIDLYVREYIRETKVDVLIALDLHRSLLFWDKLYTLLYASTLILALANKLDDNIVFITLLGEKYIIYPSSNPRDIIEHIRNTICSLGDYPAEPGIDKLLTLLPVFRKIRGVMVLTDYAINPYTMLRLGRVVRTMNTGFGAIISTNIYEVKPPLEEGILYFTGISRGFRTGVMEAYNEIKKHVSRVKASILSTTNTLVELYGLEEARDERMRIMRSYVDIRGRRRKV